MNGQEVLYAYPSVGIAIALFLLMLAANEGGFRVGRSIKANSDGETRSLIGSILASVLGMLALLLGFTFSMSMQRFDQRSVALIEEANAIGTAALRTGLLEEPDRSEARALMRTYIDARIQGAAMELIHREERSAYAQQVRSLQAQLWTTATRAAESDPRPVTSGMFVAALNDMFDAQGARSARLEQHVPELVLMLLFLVFVVTGGLLGYSCGLSGRRIVIPTTLVALLITLIVFIIIDLDRPRRGVIQIDQSSLLDLRGAVPD